MNIDKVAFHKLLLERQEALKTNPDLPVSDEIGLNIFHLCNNLSMRRNFVGLPNREDLAQEAMITCLKGLDKYDPIKYTNPFGYFTTTAWRAMVKIITSGYQYDDRLWTIYTNEMIQYAGDYPELEINIEHDLRRLDLD